MNVKNYAFFENNERLRVEVTDYKNGNRVIEFFDADGRLHRVDGPASVTYRAGGALAYEGYFTRGECIRSREPFDWGAVWRTLATVAPAIFIVGAALLVNL